MIIFCGSINEAFLTQSYMCAWLLFTLASTLQQVVVCRRKMAFDRLCYQNSICLCCCWEDRFLELTEKVVKVRFLLHIAHGLTWFKLLGLNSDMLVTMMCQLELQHRNACIQITTVIATSIALLPFDYFVIWLVLFVVPFLSWVFSSLRSILDYFCPLSILVVYFFLTLTSCVTSASIANLFLMLLSSSHRVVQCAMAFLWCSVW